MARYESVSRQLNNVRSRIDGENFVSTIERSALLTITAMSTLSVNNLQVVVSQSFEDVYLLKFNRVFVSALPTTHLDRLLTNKTLLTRVKEEVLTSFEVITTCRPLKCVSVGTTHLSQRHFRPSCR